MSHVTIHNPRSLSAIRRLIRKHYFQIRAKPQPAELTNVLAITFRPSARTGSFNGNLIRRVGTTAMIVLSYEPHRSKAGWLTMPIRGLRAQARPDGSVRYGGDSGCLFLHDGSLMPRVRNTRSAINAANNAGLVETLLQLDRACKTRVVRIDRLPEVPRLPRILLGFAPNESPEFEDSPGLRQLAAIELAIPMERLGINGSVLLDRLLKDIWQRQLIQPSAPGNPTGKLLADAELCTQARRTLEIYEDYTDLVGAHAWNPARNVVPLELDNPAATVLARFDIDRNRIDAHNLIDQGKLDAIEQAMREALGVAADLVSRDEIYDALVDPSRPISAWSCALSALRNRLPPCVSESTTDDDLLLAARHPDQPLVASGSCRIQVIRRGEGRLQFSEEMLSRRIEADLDSIQSRTKSASRLSG